MTVTDENKDSAYITELKHKINSFVIVLEAQKKQIAKLNAMIAQKWISVDDYLPHEDDRNEYLIYNGCSYHVAYRFGDIWMNDDANFYNITHWTHIPEFNERMDECK